MDGGTEIGFLKCVTGQIIRVTRDCGVGSDCGMESKVGITNERECDSRVCASVTAICSEKSSERNESLIELLELPLKKFDDAQFNQL